MPNNKSDLTAYFDVDGTLIEYLGSAFQYSLPTCLVINDRAFLPVEKHIEKIKDHNAQGHYVVVWSAGGREWAEKIISLLKLEPYVDAIITKPNWIYDDYDPSEWMPKRQYIE